MKNSTNCYLIGIKGVGMTALAEILKNQGKNVSGSDVAEKFFTDKVLKNLKIPIKETFSEKNLPGDIDLVIYSTAYNSDNNPEIKAAQERGLKILTYPEAVAALFNQSLGLAVCGTHGKTTTSAILSTALQSLGFDPTALLGSEVLNWKSNSISGKSPLFVLEADEHQNKLKFYNPWGIIVTNIDYDHPDFYPNEKDYFSSFKDFIRRWSENKNLLTKILILNEDDFKSQKIFEELELEKKDEHLIGFFGTDESEKESGLTDFTVKIPGKVLLSGEEKFVSIELKKHKLIGEHNLYNLKAVATFLALFLLSIWKNKNYNLFLPKNQKGVDIRIFRLVTWLQTKIKNDSEEDLWLLELAQIIAESLSVFQGTRRRFEFKGKKDKVFVYDDYAHHPKEIETTLLGIKKHFPKKNLMVIFHPHTFTRTKTFLKEFAKALEIADEIGILEIYGSAREIDGEVKSQDILNLISKKEAYYFKSHKEALEFLRNKNFTKPTILVTMGAGDVWRVGEEWLK